MDRRKSSGAAPNRETEWQFDAPDTRPVGRWLENHAGKSATVTASGVRRISDTYYDTEDWRIYRAGYALRVRRRGSRSEATLKSLDAGEGGDGLKRREEISEPLTRGELPGAAGPVGGRVAPLVGDRRLRALFEVRTRRTAYVLSAGGTDGPGVSAEVALDETEIPLQEGGEPARLNRVEVEITDGEPGTLLPFLGELREAFRLSPARASKFETGLICRDLSPPARPDFGPTVIDATLTVGEVAFASMRRQLAQMLAREPGTRLGEDPEELHDMRVATRRLRAAMKVFEPALPVKMRGYEAELKHFAGALGEVRDLDVQLVQLGGWISEASAEDGEPLRELGAVLAGRRAAARERMLKTLDSRRYERFVGALAAALQKGPSARSPYARRPVTAVGPEIMGRARRRFRKAGDRIGRSSHPEEYHELRKRAKRLRYALEFFSEVYGPSAGNFVKRLKGLQDVLGDHQDAEIAKVHLRGLVKESGARPGSRKRDRLSPEAVFAMGMVYQRYDEEAARLRGAFPKAYGRVTGKPDKRLDKAMARATKLNDT